jgi:integrase
MLTEKQIKQIVRDYVKGTLNDCEELRTVRKKVSLDKLEATEESYHYLLSDAREALATNDLKHVQHSVDILLSDKGISIDSGSKEYRVLSREVLKGLVQILEVEIERLSGNYDNTFDTAKNDYTATPLPSPYNAQATTKPLTEAIEEFIKEKQSKGVWKAKTERENIASFNLFKEAVSVVLGNQDVAVVDLDKPAFLRISDIYNTLPTNINKKPNLKGKPLEEVIATVKDNAVIYPLISPVTYNKHIILISSLLKWCKQQGYTNFNPAEGMKKKITGKTSEQRKSYTTDDLAMLFNSPEFISPKRPERYWVPIISLFSGARLEEICQLHISDIVELDNIPCFDINDDGDKSLKTVSSRRLVPIHPTLIELGFMKHVSSVKKRGHSRLWPNLERVSDKYSHAIQKWYGKYNRRYVTEDKGKVFHSFRHTFVDNLKQAEVPEAIVAALVGHEHGGITFARYGKEYKPKPLLESLEKLSYKVSY